MSAHRTSRLGLVVGLVISIVPTVVGAAREPVSAPPVSWQDLLAEDSSRVVVIGEDGALTTGPFHLAARDTLWTPGKNQWVRRLAVSPRGHHVAWLTGSDDPLMLRLWIRDESGTRLAAHYPTLRPSDFDIEQYEPIVPSVRDAIIGGGRLITANRHLLSRGTSVFAWTADEKAVVYGSAEGLMLAPRDGAPTRLVGNARVIALKLLSPSPIFVARVITTTEGRRDVVDRLLFPTEGKWLEATSAGMKVSGRWAADRNTVWWADGKRIRAVRAFDPNPTVEFSGQDKVVWLEFDQARNALVWGAGREILRRPADGRGIESVLTTSEPIRRVIGSSADRVRGIVAGDSLIVWTPVDGSMRRVALGGRTPFALFQSPAGRCAVVEGSLGSSASIGASFGSHESPSFFFDPGLPLYKLSKVYGVDFDGRGLVPSATPEIKNARCFASPNGSLIFLVAPDSWIPGPVRTMDVTGHAREISAIRIGPEGAEVELTEASGARHARILHAYDLDSGRWIEVEHPGVAAWEPVAP